MRVPCSQENLSGKDLDEQSGDSWVPVMAQSGHEGDKLSGKNWVIVRAHSGHEGEEQSVAGQAIYRTYSFHMRESVAECQNGVKWLERLPSR